MRQPPEPDAGHSLMRRPAGRAPKSFAARAAQAIGIIAIGLCGATPLAGQVPTTGSITGTVWDSTRAGPLGAAEVFLIGAGITVVTNDDGRFFIPDLRPGPYAVGFRHARLDLLGWAVEGRTIEVRAGETLDVQLAVPKNPPAAAAPIPVTVPPQVSGPGAPAVIVGTVVDATSGRGITGATVQVRGTPIGIVTDARGRFVLFGVPPGGHDVDVAMLGYAPRSTPMAAVAGATLEVTIALSTQPIELDPVVVEVRSRSLDRVGFYERVDDPGIRGHFLMPAEIEKRAPAAFTDLFTNVPGARVDYYGPGRSAVIFRRIVGTGGGDGCVPELYLDGMRIRGADWGFIAPSMVDGVEVYLGANVPINFSTNACGVVLVWTKRGG